MKKIMASDVATKKPKIEIKYMYIIVTKKTIDGSRTLYKKRSAYFFSDFALIDFLRPEKNIKKEKTARVIRIILGNKAGASGIPATIK
jgi:hypothetical protein